MATTTEDALVGIKKALQGIEKSLESLSGDIDLLVHGDDKTTRPVAVILEELAYGG